MAFSDWPKIFKFNLIFFNLRNPENLEKFYFNLQKSLSRKKFINFKGSNVDLEDLGDFVKPKNEVRPNRTRVPKEMISDKLRTALTKQGYHLVGSHSGVKICRWTKNQLRGRGGCYKEKFEKLISFFDH